MTTGTIPRAVLGKTGLEVTRLGYGAMEVRGSRIWGGRPVTEEQADRILNAVVDAGINFIDTSNDYGRSEEFIGKFLAHRREQYILATKCGCTVVRRDENTDDTPHVWTRDNLFRGLHESLKRMKTDYVDLIQLHNPPTEEVERNDLVRVLQEMREQGKTRYIGISTTLPHLPAYLGMEVFDTFQIPYSALERTHEEWMALAAEHGLGIIVRGGVARGEPGAGLGNQDRWANFEEAKLDELLEPGQSRTSFMLRYTLRHPSAHTIIVGTLHPEHLAENLEAAAQGPLSEEVYTAARDRLALAGVVPAPFETQ